MSSIERAERFAELRWSSERLPAGCNIGSGFDRVLRHEHCYLFSFTNSAKCCFQSASFVEETDLNNEARQQCTIPIFPSTTASEARSRQHFASAAGRQQGLLCCAAFEVSAPGKDYAGSSHPAASTYELRAPAEEVLRQTTAPPAAAAIGRVRGD
jgi:hypothetical protein